MNISASAVKELRDRTGVGIMDCKRALESCEGDMERAAEMLRQKGLAVAQKRAARVASQGVVDSYIHAGGRIGVLVELNCESDFVARSDEFRALAHEIAMQVAATSPQYISPDDVPAEEADRKAELALLAQPSIRNSSLTVQDLVNEKLAKYGEAIRVRRFVRFELGGGQVLAGE